MAILALQMRQWLMLYLQVDLHAHLRQQDSSFLRACIAAPWILAGQCSLVRHASLA